MCETYFLKCSCGAGQAELFFGKMLLGPGAVHGLFCPQCSGGHDAPLRHRVLDNGWVLELNMDIIDSHASTFGASGDHLTASWVFDSGYVTWAGITPDDGRTRNREREKIQHLATTDLRAYVEAMKTWGIERQQRFSSEGWRKMRH